MEGQQGTRFNVYQMDMYADGVGGWIENSRLLIGSVTLPAESLEDVTEVMTLKALKKARFTDMTGVATVCPLTTQNRKVVYAEDFFDDGRWWEVGLVRGHRPLYGLAPAA